MPRCSCQLPFDYFDPIEKLHKRQVSLNLLVQKIVNAVGFYCLWFLTCKRYHHAIFRLRKRMTHNELIKLVLDGNQEAFRSIVEQYKANVFRTCLGFVHNREDAEELTQDVFVNAYRNLNRFKGDSAFSTWIYRIAVNSSLNHLRKHKRRSFIQRFENIFSGKIYEDTSATTAYWDSPEKRMIDEERNNQLYKAIDSLPENQRIAFSMSKYEELPQREIASIMNITEGAVEALLQRAKANLQKKLTAYIKMRKPTVGNPTK